MAGKKLFWWFAKDLRISMLAPMTGSLAVAVCCHLIGFIGHSAFAQSPKPPVDVHVQWELRSPQARQWDMQLTVVDPEFHDASIGEVENASVSDRTTGAIEIDREGRILRFRPRQPINGAKLRFRLRTSADARLIIEEKESSESSPAGASQQKTHRQEMAIADLIRQGETESRAEPADDARPETPTKPGWSLTRIEGDPLQLEGLPSLPIVDPESEIEFSFAVHALAQYPSQRCEVQYSLYRLASGQTVASHRIPIRIDPLGNGQSDLIHETIPGVPGVYELRYQLRSQDENIWFPLRRRNAPIVQITRPIVVRETTPKHEQEIQSSDPSGDDSTPWQVVQEIQPWEDHWSVGQLMPSASSRLIPTSLPSRTVPPTEPLPSKTVNGENVGLIPPGGVFQAKIPIQSAGSPHQITIRLLQNEKSRIRLELLSSGDASQAVFSQVVDVAPTALRIGTTDETHRPWHTHSVICYPNKNHHIRIVNLESEHPVSLGSITISAGPSHIGSIASAVADGSENRLCVLRLNDDSWIDVLSADIAALPQLQSCADETVAVARLWAAAQRMADHVRAVGCQSVLIPANDGGRLWFPSSTLFARQQSDLDAHRLTLLLEKFSIAGLDVFLKLHAGMQLTQVESELRRADEERAMLLQPDSNPSRYQWQHPIVAAALTTLVSELDQFASHHSAFQGIAIEVDPSSHWYPVESSPQVQTNGLVEHSSAPRVTGDDGSNAQSLASKSDRNAQPASSDAFGQLEALRATLSDRRHLILLTPGTTIRGSSSTKADESSQDGFEIVHSISLGAPDVLSATKAFQDQLESVGKSAKHRGLAMNSIGGSSIHHHVRSDITEKLVSAIDRLDPTLLIVDVADAVATASPEAESVLRAFRQLPIAPLQPVPPSDPSATMVGLATSTGNQHRWIAITNRAPWVNDVDLEMLGASRWELVSRDLNENSQTRLRRIDTTRWRVTIPANQFLVMRSDSIDRAAEIHTWAPRIHGGSDTLAQIKNQVTHVVERVGMLDDFPTYDVLSNGGFERSGGMGLIGWLHSQYPPGSVRIDDRERFEGNQSILLTTLEGSPSRTWIVTETIAPPRSGRLAVSLTCRCPRQPNQSTHRLRVSIEGTQSGVPIRIAKEFNVPRNGNWMDRTVVLEADGLEKPKVDSLRVTIDSLSAGRVWIDDVRLHDHFPLASEREEVKSLAFLAVQGLRRGNPEPAARLLQNHWAQELLKRSGSSRIGRENPQAPALESTQSDSPVKAVDGQEPTPGVAERIRSWLPRPLRF